MIEDLVCLVQLQEIDLRIKEQELAQEEFPSAVKELEGQINKAKASHDNAISKLQQAESEKKSFEEQIQHTKDMLDKSQDRLNSIKTNREYDAVHAEIETQKNMINNAEQRRKNLDDEINRLKTAAEENSKTLESTKAENEPKISDLKQKIDAIDSNIAEITKERDKVTPKISKQTLRTYDQIHRKRKNGKALSLVSSSKTCTVCYKVLEPQLYNEIRKGNKIILCQNCGSIFVWDEKAAGENQA